MQSKKLYGMKHLFGLLPSILNVLTAHNLHEIIFLQRYLPDTDLFVIVMAILIKQYITTKVTFCHGRGPLQMHQPYLS